MKNNGSHSETLAALCLALTVMALCTLAAREVKIWDMRSLRSKIERLFAIDITSSLPPPTPRTQQEESAGVSAATIGDTATMFAQTPEKPEGSLPEISLDAFQPPELPAQDINLAPPAPQLDALPARAAALEPAAPEAVAALRRKADDRPGALAQAARETAGSYAPTAPRMAPTAAFFPVTAPEITPKFMEIDSAPAMADITLPVPAATAGELRDLMRARPAGGYPSLDSELLSRLEYSPRDARGRRCFRLSFRLRPESKLPAIAKDVLFLLDVSQSIERHQINAMGAAIAEYVRTLRPGDRWNAIKFSENIYSFREDFLPAGEPVPEDFARFCSRVPGEYMTDLFDATRAILQRLPDTPRPCNVFLLTDGFATYGRQEVSQLLAGFRRGNRDRFSILPFMVGDKGMEDLLKLLAHHSRGFFRRQTGGKEQAAAEMLDFFRDYDQPVLFACVPNFANLSGESVYPTVLPNLYRGQEITLYGREELAPDAAVRVLGWGENNQPREFYFRPTPGQGLDAAGGRIRKEWAFGAAMDHIQAVVEAPDRTARAEKVGKFREFLNASGLDELREMTDLLEKNK